MKVKRNGRTYIRVPKKVGTKKDQQQDRQIAMLKRKVNRTAPEVCFLDYTFNLSPDWVSGTISVLNNPAQGVLDTNRQGDTIDNLAIHLQAWIYKSAAVINQTVLIMLLWVPSNFVPASLNDLLQNTGNIYTPMSGLLWDKRKNFKVLYKKVLLLDAINATTRKINVIKKLKGKKTQFNAATTNINTGSLFLVTASDATVNVPAIYGYTRFTFIG